MTRPRREVWCVEHDYGAVLIVSPQGDEALAREFAAKCPGRRTVVRVLPAELVERLAGAAMQIHEECCSVGFGTQLSEGPMIAPSESAVLSLRAALRDFAGEGEET